MFYEMSLIFYGIGRRTDLGKQELLSITEIPISE
jgi:hypothetical protein